MYFSDAVAVFEGGGVRGIAHGGACAAAELHGVRFRAAIGTSVGSIAAALIAAGIRGDAFSALFRKLPLQRFLSKPTPIRGFRAWLVKRLCRVGLGESGDLLTHSYFAQGSYSSKPIEDWLNEVLCEHFSNAKAPVRFSQLPHHLTVVAADLQRAELHSWSTDRNADDSVAFAVRCSCTVPFLFVPVYHQGACLVDGGTLANLPVLMLNKHEYAEYLPTLAFRLIATGVSPLTAEARGNRLLPRLVDTAISGQTELHLGLSRPSQVIRIPTGAVSSMAFHIDATEVAKLYESGFKTAHSFFESESANVSQSGFLARWLRAGRKANLYDQTMIQFARANAEISVHGGDLSWARRLWPLLLSATSRNVSVRVLHSSAALSTRIAFLRTIGCSTRLIAGTCELRGSLIDPRNQGSAVLADAGKDSGRVLDATDRQLIRTLADYFDRLWNEGERAQDARPCSFVSVNADWIAQTMRANVTQYRNTTISFESIRIEDTRPLARRLETAKARAAGFVIDFLKGNSHDLFDPLMSTDGCLFLAPPVLEDVDGALVVIDGAHRIYSCIRRGISSVRALVVTGGSEALPAAVGEWEHVFPQPGEVARKDRYKYYNAQAWRTLKEAWCRINSSRNGQ